MIRLIVGLGNPGTEYENNRHNIGFMVVDQFLAKKRGKYTEEKPLYHLATVRIKGQHLCIAKPQTYMNLSGEAVKTLAQRLDIITEEILVVADDFALPFGKLRVRKQGSDGGHNGLASIIEELGTTAFRRLRLGIGPCPEDIRAEDFVLEEFCKEELDKLPDFIKLGVRCIETTLYCGIDAAMNEYNG